MVPLGLLVVLAAVPFLAPSPFWQRQLILISINSMVVVGLNLSYGFAGELALGQAAMFAAGAYTTGILATNHHNNVALTLPASAMAAIVVGFASGVPGLRLGGWALAMASFFLILLIPDIVSIFPVQTGGFAGLSAIPSPKIGSAELDNNGYYLLVLAVTAVTFVCFRNLMTSRHAAALRVLRQSPILASSLGIPVFRMKLMAYVVGAIPAGLAGSLFAYLDGFIAPESFGFGTSVAFLAASILGGAQSVYGAIVGAAILQLGPLRSTAFQQYSLIVYGLFLVVGGVFLSGGLSGAAGTVVRRLRLGSRFPSPVALARPVVARRELGDLPGATLSVVSASKSFGGVHAVRDVSMTAEPGQITAVIGANGSGKTTLLNLISGYYRIDSGDIRLGDQPLTGHSPTRIAQAGVGRTFQTPAIPAGLSAAEVVATARYARHRSGLLAAVLRLPSYRRAVRQDRIEAARLLGYVGIEHFSRVDAVALSLGTRRLMELARALAGTPSLLLLDEPASGLASSEIDEFAAVMRDLRGAGATVVLVEHNFPLVLAVADRIYVLERGIQIAAGTPDEIRHDERVATSYLGQQVDATA